MRPKSDSEESLHHLSYSKSGAGNIASGQSVHGMAGGPGTNPGPSSNLIQAALAPMVHPPANPGKAGNRTVYRGN